MRNTKNTKWTRDQDRKLQDAVKKFGTQWGQVFEELHHTRSQNAIIKRWHGYIKPNLDQIDNTMRAKRQEAAEEIEESNQSDSQEESGMIDESEEDIQTEKNNHELIKKMMQEDYGYKIEWTSEDDVRLKDLVVRHGVFQWEELAGKFSTDEEDAKNRWIKAVFPRIRNTHKIGGAVKWSASEDSILYGADKHKVSYLDLMFFLPGRTVYSIEARWRRIAKNPEFIGHMALINNREAERQNALATIARKRHEERQRVMNEMFEAEREDQEKKKLEQEKQEVMRNHNKYRKDKS